MKAWLGGKVRGGLQWWFIPWPQASPHGVHAQRHSDTPLHLMEGACHQSRLAWAHRVGYMTGGEGSTRQLLLRSLTCWKRRQPCKHEVKDEKDTVSLSLVDKRKRTCHLERREKRDTKMLVFQFNPEWKKHRTKVLHPRGGLNLYNRWVSFVRD